MKNHILIVFILVVFLLGAVYFFRTFNSNLNKVPVVTDDLTTLRGGTIYAKVYCVENNNKFPCKGGFSIKSKIGNDQAIIRTSDEDGNLTASFEVGEYLLFPLPPSNPRFNLVEVSPNEVKILQGKIINVEVLYKSD